MNSQPDLNELRRIESLRLAVQTGGGVNSAATLGIARQFESYLNGSDRAALIGVSAEEAENRIANYEAPLDDGLKSPKSTYYGTDDEGRPSD